MKTAKLIELERDRLGIIGEARDALAALQCNGDRTKEPALAKAHDDVMLKLSGCDLDITEAKLESESANERNSQRPNSDGQANGADDGSPSFRPNSGWIDERGKAVRVVSPSEQMGTRSSDVLGFGDVVRAKITGARNDDEKRALAEGTDSAGGYTVPTPLAGQFIDRMRAKSVAIRAGAMTVPMTSETLAIARLETDPSCDWRAENAAIDEGDPTFGRVLFSAKSLAGMIRVSRELMEDSINVGSMIEEGFAGAMANKLDYAAIWGDGTSNAPTGVVNTAGINSVSMATNGAAITDYDKLIDAVYELQADNADDPTGMIYSPRTGAALAKLKDGDGNPLSVPQMVAGIPRFYTSAAPIDETQGTATTASSIVFGDYKHLLIGMRTNLEIRVYDQPFVGNGQLAVVAWMRADVQLAQPKSFTQLKGITP